MRAGNPDRLPRFVTGAGIAISPAPYQFRPAKEGPA